MPCHVRLVDTTVCATACIDVRVDASIVLGSVHAHVHFGPYASTADSTDACSHDGTAVSLDDSGGHRFDTIIVPSLAPPRRRRRRRRRDHAHNGIKDGPAPPE